MAPWVIPALKAVLPHVGTIVSAATPVFTKRRAAAGKSAGQAMEAAAEPGLSEQIAELQAAAGQNAKHIKALAAQLQGTVQALELGAEQAQRSLRRLSLLCMGASALAVLAMVVAMAAWMR